MSGSANTKLLGSPPESFDGSPAKAEAFWNNLEIYYYLNESMYSDQGKRVSAALTHFKVSTSAREWAQDKQKRALSATPVDFGTWVDFRNSFKRHFVPAYSKLEATNAMYTSKMGGHPFNEWYQDWSTFASQSGVLRSDPAQNATTHRQRTCLHEHWKNCHDYPEAHTWETCDQKDIEEEKAVRALVAAEDDSYLAYDETLLKSPQPGNNASVCMNTGRIAMITQRRIPGSHVQKKTSKKKRPYEHSYRQKTTVTLLMTRRAESASS
ncbi:hypothetical protein EI94DRAFT_1816250 [Lactarius quietus]|nr:hypothetical protein EI94DRAFT_1816250 [Lactarius quietus]